MSPWSCEFVQEYNPQVSASRLHPPPPPSYRLVIMLDFLQRIWLVINAWLFAKDVHFVHLGRTDRCLNGQEIDIWERSLSPTSSLPYVHTVGRAKRHELWDNEWNKTNIKIHLIPFFFVLPGTVLCIFIFTRVYLVHFSYINKHFMLLQDLSDLGLHYLPRTVCLKTFISFSRFFSPLPLPSRAVRAPASCHHWVQ